MTNSQVEYIERMVMESYQRHFGVKPRMWLRYPSHQTPDTRHQTPDNFCMNPLNDT